MAFQQPWAVRDEVTRATYVRSHNSGELLSAHFVTSDGLGFADPLAEARRLST
jgi:hypothetical protein